MCTLNLPNEWNSIFSTYFSIIQYPEIKVAMTHLKYLGKIWMQNWYQCYKKILPKPTTMQHQLWKSYILPVWIQVSEWLPTYMVFLNHLFNVFKSILLLSILHLGPDHLQLTLLNWDTESVIALNKKLKVNWKFQFFI